MGWVYIASGFSWMRSIVSTNEVVFIENHRRGI